MISLQKLASGRGQGHATTSPGIIPVQNFLVIMRFAENLL